MKKLLVVLAVLAGIFLSGCIKGDDEMRVYVGDYLNDRIVILDMDLNWVGSFSADVERPFGITADESYVYVSNSIGTNDEVRKYSTTSPYAKVDEVTVYTACDLAQDADYLYLAERRKIGSIYYHYVCIIQKSDMSIVERFESFPSSPTALASPGIAVDDDYIYCVEQYDKLRKFNKSTHALVLEETSHDIEWYGGLGIDSAYLYLVGDDNSILIVNKSDLSLYKKISNVGELGTPFDPAATGGFIYSANTNDNQIEKIKISTEATVATFGVLGEAGNDDSHLYDAGPVCIGTYYLAPTAPTSLLCNGQTNPTDVVPSYFSAVYHGSLSGVYYQIQVNEESDFSGRVMWDSGKASMSSIGDGERCSNIFYDGQTLSLSAVKYYWKIKFWDTSGSNSGWSATANFTTGGKEDPWAEDTVEPTGEANIEIPRGSGEWTALGDIMRIHTANGKDTSSPRAPIEIGQAEVICCNISKNFNSFEEASAWYKNLIGYAIQIKIGYSG